MALDLSRWRELVNKERRLLAELAVILLATLVVGVFFLENVDSTTASQRRQAAESMAEQLAHSAAEYVVTANLVSLNVVAAHAADLPVVARVEFRSAADGVLASAGDNTLSGAAPAAVERAIRLDDGAVAGSVRLWPTVPERTLSARLENGFVLIVLCLLTLRVLAELLWRRLSSRPAVTDSDEDEDMEADILPVLTLSSGGQGAVAWLRLSIVNFDRMKKSWWAISGDWSRLPPSTVPSLWHHWVSRRRFDLPPRSGLKPASRPCVPVCCSGGWPGNCPMSASIATARRWNSNNW